MNCPRAPWPLHWCPVERPWIQGRSQQEHAFEDVWAMISYDSSSIFLPYQNMSKYSLTPWNCKTKQLQQHLIEGPKSAIDSGLCSALPQTVISLQEIRWFSMVIIHGIYASQLSFMVKSMQVPWCDNMAGILRWAVLVLFASFPCSPLVKTRTVGKVLF